MLEHLDHRHNGLPAHGAGLAGCKQLGAVSAQAQVHRAGMQAAILFGCVHADHTQLAVAVAVAILPFCGSACRACLLHRAGC